jgi:hypothetical protein
MKTLIGLIYPFTKAKLHRALNFLGTLLTAAAVVAVWASSLDLADSIGATLVLVTTFLTQGKKAIAKLDAGVDSLPIPADDEPTKPLGPTNIVKLTNPSSNTPVIVTSAKGSDQ